MLRALIEHLDVGVLACDRQGRLTHANRRVRQLVGRCPHHLPSQHWPEFFRLRHPDGRRLNADHLPLRRALAGETVRDVEILVGDDGLRLSTSGRPIHDAGGRSLGAVLVLQDVTEQRADEEQLRRELEDLGWTARVRDALEEGRFLLHAQPIVDVASGALVMEELLVRMRGEDGELIGPAQFLCAAERQGAIGDIDLWVLGQAADLAASGRAVAVNVSARTMGDPTFMGAVDDILVRRRIDPSLLTFEITETAIVSDIVQACRFAERLEHVGSRLALDDFGTGYAAFTYLKHLPVQFLKIDMEFVRDLRQNPRSRALVGGIVALARGFGQRTIAEGVEDAETLGLLRELGVDLAQGYFIGRPKPVAASPSDTA
ncbi:MAG: hypothetical protein JWM73_2066 [Solirubrobacterales bacterium]|nr:hypothetical protein [Solirubrobacterales bacterium]